jgi:hypothetical protein
MTGRCTGEVTPMGLAAFGNTYNPSLLVLKEKGYQLRAETTTDGEHTLWTASKGEDSFLGYSPPELLGVVVLWETLGPNWNQQKPNLLGELLDLATEE